MRKASRVIFFLTLVGAMALLVFSQQAATAQPPAKGAPLKHLVKQTDGHWTPYAPPAVPEGSQVHIVAAGDTLWDLSRQYLNDPYLWPQIWEQNHYVANPHWIYPGDPLLIVPPKLVEQPVAEPLEEDAEPAKPLESLQNRLPKTAPAYRPMTVVIPELDLYHATDAELYGTGRITPSKQDFAAFIVGSEKEHDQRYLAPGDVVFLNKGMRENVFPGQRYQILRSAGEVLNPLTKKFIGHYYLELGTLKVIIAHDDNAVAEIDLATRPVYIGDGLVPFVEKAKIKKDKEHKLQRFLEDNGKATGNIVFIEEKLTLGGPGHICYLDLGKSASLAPGQICTIYRVEGSYKPTIEFFPAVDETNFKERRNKEFIAESNQALKQRDLPRIILGELVIIEIFENTCKARIMDSRQDVLLGDYVQVQ